MQRKILFIDDNIDAFHLLNRQLTPENMQIEWAGSAQVALLKLEAGQFDLVLLDVLMPYTDGWELCQMIRLFSNIPIIFYTCLYRENEIIRGLQCGADDYIVKPVNKQLLLARIDAVLRRYMLSQSYMSPRLSLVKANRPIYRDGYLTLDLNSHKVFVEDRLAHLTTIEYKLLAYLFQNAGQVLSFDQILDTVWPQNDGGGANYVHTYISRLRRKLEKDPNAPRYLLTAYGVGYCFEKQPPQDELQDPHKFAYQT